MMSPAWMRRTALVLAVVQQVAAAMPAVVAAPDAPLAATGLRTGLPAPSALSVHWPQPAVSRPPQPEGPVLLALVRPNFQAPSAEHCSGPIETRERVEGPPPFAADRPGVTGRTRRTEEARITHDEASDRARPSESRASSPAGVAATGGVTSSPVPSMSMAAPGTPPAPAPLADRTAKMAATPGPAIAQAQPPVRPEDPPAAQGPVTAGMVDDNAAFSEYLAFRRRHTVPHRPRDVRERYLLEVTDARGEVVPDAEVAVRAAAGATLWARTDAGGKAWIHPDSFDPSRARFYEVTVRQGQRQSTGILRRGQQSSLEIALGGTAATRPARLDLVFLVDATGSMGDEIDALKRNLRSIVDEVSRLPSRPDLCLGLVAYRDRGDAFLVRSHDLTDDVGAFQGVLDALRADGGGDYPEAMSEAFNEVVHRIRWRGDGATRLVVLLADAPPHLDYGGPQYDEDMLAALGKGIKVFSVGASGLDRQGEYIQRQIAQYTGGRFVFLTYAQAARPASGPGRETVHDVRGYSVQTLDRLIVKLVSDELARRPRGG